MRKHQHTTVAGNAQYHINADIMYAMRKYVPANGHELFLHQCGAEMLVACLSG